MSEITHREAKEVVKPETLVFAAKITKAEKTGDEDGVYRTWKVADVKAWQGALPAVHTLTWKMMHPIMRDESGKIVGHYSPLVPSSGEEPSPSLPMYIPGRSRMCSRQSRDLMSASVYSAMAIFRES